MLLKQREVSTKRKEGLQRYIQSRFKPLESATLKNWEVGENPDDRSFSQATKDSESAVEQSLRNCDDSTEISAIFSVQDVTSNGVSLSNVPNAILQAAAGLDFDGLNPASLALCAASTAKQLQNPNPASWYMTAGLSLLLVWVATLSATVVAFVTPTVGIDCHALSYLAFGLSSSLSWATQFLDSRQNWVSWVSLGTRLSTILALGGVFLLQACFHNTHILDLLVNC